MMIKNIIAILAQTYSAPDNLPQQAANNDALTNVFNAVLALGGAVAVAYIIYGGIKFSISNGDPAKVKEAREAIIYSVIGLIIVIISFTLINFVIGKI